MLRKYCILYLILCYMITALTGCFMDKEPEKSEYSYVYAANNSYISVYEIDNDDASLTLTWNIDTGSAITCMAMSPDGKYLCAGHGTYSFKAYYIKDNGNLSLIASSSLPGNPAEMVMDSGHHLYIADNTSNRIIAYDISASGLIQISLSTGTINGPVSIAVNPSGTALYAGTSYSSVYTMYGFTLASSTGQLTLRSSIDQTSNGIPGSIAVSVNGNYVYAGSSDNSRVTLYSSGAVNPGDLTLVTSSSVTAQPYVILTDSSGSYLLSASYYSITPGAELASYSISSSTGQIGSKVSAVSLPAYASSAYIPVALVMHPENNYIYYANGNGIRVYSFDSSDGRLSYAGYSYGLSGVTGLAIATVSQ